MKIFTIIVVLVSLVVSAEAQVQCVADIALVIDESGSIQDTDPGNWGLQINFVKNLIQNLDVGLDSTRVAAVTFSNFARLHFNLSKFSTDQQMMNAIDSILYAGGNTNTTGGLLLTLEQVFTRSGGDRDGVEDIIILITDGNPTWDVDTLDDVVNRIKNQGILIIGVGVTDRVNITVFRDIVSPPFDEHYFPVNAFDQLSSILDDLITSSCRTIRPTPAPTPTQPAPEACSNIADIVSVMDASGSIGDTNFGIMKNFISDLVSDLDIGQNRVRVGLETFADNNQPFFQLNTFYSRTDMMAAVSEVPYSRGRTNTASAINYLTNTMFTSGNGDRSNAGNIAVIITDGGSNNKIETLREAFEAKSQGIHIIVISVGNWVDQEELIGMATYPYQNNLISVDNVNALAGIKDKLRNLVCNNVNECFSNPCRNGGQCVDGIEMYICICPSGWAGVNCDQRCRVGADLVFALDASGSIGRENFQKQVDFVKDIVYGINLNGDSRVGVLTYADNPDVRFHLDEFTTRMDVLNALALFYSGGTTNTASAISTMDSNMFQSNQGDRGNYDNIGVVMTDGRSNDELATWQAALTARRNDIQMLAIGVGNNVNVMELEGIASAPVSSNVFTVNNFDSLSSIANNLIQAVCDEQNECNSNPCRNGGTCVDLINGYECHCTSQWTGVNCEKGCSGKLDVIFIIDASGSIRNERFPYVIDYMVSIAESFEIRDDKTRVGAVKFSDNAEIQFHLNEYQTRQDVLQALKRITFIGGRTNTASALQLMMDNMFTAGNGDREDAQNIVVILTDGNSNINEDMTIPYAIDAKLLGTHVIVAAVGSDLNELELRGMASMPISNTLYMVNSWTGLQSIRTPVIESTCNDQNDCQSNPCQNGGQCVDTFNRYFCICQPDWSGERCNRRCSRQMDVVFVLDISGSMDQVYDLVIAVTKEIVQGLPMSFSRARVGLVHYSDNAQVNFNLFKYQSREEVLNAIAFRKAGGRTNTQEAIRMANQNVFTSSSGDRSGVPNIMVVVTDGGSNVNEYQTAIEAQNARNNGIEIYAIALGNSPEMGEINEIASTPQSEHVIQLPNESQVSQAASTLLDSLCQQ